MARLTRTQKYADLRDQLANDRETSIATDDLKSYEDKLKNVESILNNNPVNEEILKKEEKPEPSFEEVKNQNPFDNATKVDDQSFYDFLSSIDSFSQPQKENNDVTTPIAEFEEKVEEPVVLQKEEKEEDSLINDTISLDEMFASIEKPEPVIEKQEEPIINEVHEGLDDIVQQLESDLDSLNGPVEEVKEEKPEPQPETVVLNEVNNNYINDTIKEVNEYNKNDGLKTMDDIPESMVNAIRHPEEQFNKGNSVDDDFSNTVTLEIDKVLNEIKNSDVEKEPVVEEPVIPEPVVVETPVIPEPVVEQAPLKEETLEHPVLTKRLEEEVEIRSMEETLREDVLDDTIPFIVNNNEEAVEEYVEEEEAPNKVLNIILIVLIVILLAILGVIVYYILFAKGIIG